MPVAFEELVGSPIVRISDGVFSATRKLKIAWSDSVAFAAELLGTFAFSGGVYTYTLPAIFPAFPRAICREAIFEPFPEDKISTGASSGLETSTNQPPFAIVTANYSVPQNATGQDPYPDSESVPAGTYLTARESFGVEMQSTPGRGYKWKSDNLPVSEDVGVFRAVGIGALSLTWHRIPPNAIPIDTIQKRRGTVNVSKFLRYKAKTLLFGGADIGYEAQYNGQTLADVTYNFSIKGDGDSGNDAPHNWQYFYYPEKGIWDIPEAVETSRSVYETADFKDLLKFDGT